MISALAKAGSVFHEEEAICIAKQAMSFLETHLVQQERLMVRYREGDVKHLGFIEDYAHMLTAYMSLYEATFDLDWLTKARAVAENMFELFWDEQIGAFSSQDQMQKRLSFVKKKYMTGPCRLVTAPHSNSF